MKKARELIRDAVYGGCTTVGKEHRFQINFDEVEKLKELVGESKWKSVYVKSVPIGIGGVLIVETEDGDVDITDYSWF